MCRCWWGRWWSGCAPGRVPVSSTRPWVSAATPRLSSPPPPGRARRGAARPRAGARHRAHPSPRHDGRAGARGRGRPRPGTARAPSRNPHLPGDPHRGERRAGRAGALPRRRLPRAPCARPARRARLPLARGPAREGRLPPLGGRRPLPAAGLAPPPGDASRLPALRGARHAAPPRARAARARGRAGDAARPGPSRRPRPPPARDAGARQGTSGDPAVTLPGPPQARMLAVAGVFAGLLALIVLRAVDLTVLRGPELARLAALQHRARIALTSHRGPIVDRHGEALALSLDVPSVYVRPREFGRQDVRLAALAAALHLPLRTVRSRTARAERFVWLERQVPPREAEAVEQLGLKGVYTVQEGRRFYPHHGLAAHVLGFVGVDSQGLEGLERRLDPVIRGQPRDVEADRDGRRQMIFTAGVPAPPAQGSRVELTIDAGIQDVTERELAAGVAAARAAGGAAVVLDPSTGEVLALANVPAFDPNQPGRLGDRGWRDRVRNRAITDPYEPGSTFKAILAAAAIEEQLVKPTDLFFCENGRYQIGRWRIHDSHRHGWLSFAQVIQYSR